MIQEVWQAEYERTGDAVAADDAVFKTCPELQRFVRYGRKGDGPPDDSWVGQPITVERAGRPT